MEGSIRDLSEYRLKTAKEDQLKNAETIVGLVDKYIQSKKQS